MVTGVFFGFLAVVLGAFGAHGLENVLSSKYMEAYQTGVDYQMYHALLLFLLGSTDKLSVNSKKWVYRLLVAGILCFSFSLYIMASASIMAMELGAFGIVTPIGGVLLITGWLLLAYRIFKPLN